MELLVVIALLALVIGFFSGNAPPPRPPAPADKPAAKKAARASSAAPGGLSHGGRAPVERGPEGIPAYKLFLVVTLLGVTALALIAGFSSVPLIGGLFEGLGRLVWLCTVAMTGLALAWLLPLRVPLLARLLLAVLLVPLLLLNTRLPHILADRDRILPPASYPLKRPEYPVGTPLHIVADTEAIVGRVRPYGSVVWSCGDSWCFSSKGVIVPGIGHGLWRESIAETAADFGFSAARPGERAPTLRVGLDGDEFVQVLSMAFLDEDGVTVAQQSWLVRLAFPGETFPDLTPPRPHDTREPEPANWWERIVHDNLLVSRLRPASADVPLRPLNLFLRKAQHTVPPRLPDGSLIGFGDEWLRVDSPGHDGSTFEPGDAYVARSKACSEFLQGHELFAEINEGSVMHWQTFRQDTAGRVAIPGDAKAFCSGEDLWTFRREKPGQYELARYGTDGAYRGRILLGDAHPQGGIGLIPAAEAHCSSYDCALVFESVREGTRIRLLTFGTRKTDDPHMPLREFRITVLSGGGPWPWPTVAARPLPDPT